MGRFHRHDDGTGHEHEHAGEHAHDAGDHSGYATGGERVEVLTRIFDENDRTAVDTINGVYKGGLDNPMKMMEGGA